MAMCMCACAFVRVRERGVKETPKETAEQEQIVKSTVPSRSNWGTWCFCQALKTHTQVCPQRRRVLSRWLCSSATVGWHQGCSRSRTPALPAAGREQQKFTSVKGTSKC